MKQTEKMIKFSLITLIGIFLILLVLELLKIQFQFIRVLLGIAGIIYAIITLYALYRSIRFKEKTNGLTTLSIIIVIVAIIIMIVGAIVNNGNEQKMNDSYLQNQSDRNELNITSSSTLKEKIKMIQIDMTYENVCHIMEANGELWLDMITQTYKWKDVNNDCVLIEFKNNKVISIGDIYKE